MELSTWPPEAIVAMIAALVTNLVTGIGLIVSRKKDADTSLIEIHRLGWQEANVRGELIETLRRLLDRGRRRESAYATGFEILVLQLPDQLTPHQLEAVTRARSLFEGALLQSSDGSANL